MKYIVYWEFESKDFETCAKKYADLPKELEGTSISENFAFLGETRGFQLLEVDDPAVISKLSFYYAPETDFTILPIVEVSQVMDAYKQLKS